MYNSWIGEELISIANTLIEALQYMVHWSGVFCISATIVSRITPWGSDDRLVRSFISFLPTWGFNPGTKKILDLLDARQKGCDNPSCPNFKNKE